MSISSRQMCSNTRIFADFSAANLGWCGDCVPGGVLTVYCDFWSEIIFAIHRQWHVPCGFGIGPTVLLYARFFLLQIFQLTALASYYRLSVYAH